MSSWTTSWKKSRASPKSTALVAEEVADEAAGRRSFAAAATRRERVPRGVTMAAQSPLDAAEAEAEHRLPERAAEAVVGGVRGERVEQAAVRLAELEALVGRRPVGAVRGERGGVRGAERRPRGGDGLVARGVRLASPAAARGRSEGRGEVAAVLRGEEWSRASASRGAPASSRRGGRGPGGVPWRSRARGGRARREGTLREAVEVAHEAPRGWTTG